MARRLKGRYGYPADEPFRLTLHPDRLDEPLHWRKPRRVFVVSMGDLFHEDVPDEFIAQVFGVMAITCPNAWLVDGRPVPIGPHHTFQVLTKRPERMRQLLTDSEFPALIGSVSGMLPMLPMPHVWLGVTAEDQQRADERIPILLDTPAAVRFVSCEPLLGPVDLDGLWNDPEWYCPRCDRLVGAASVKFDETHDLCGEPVGTAPVEKPFWVIAGGESGPGARPTRPDWVRSLRDQCQAAGTPFYFKGWGEWLSTDQGAEDVRHLLPDTPQGQYLFYRVGKKAAGHDLDGREHREFPEVARA